MDTRQPTRLVVRLPEASLKAVDELAAEAGRSRSEIVRYALARLTIADLPDGWVRDAEASRLARRAA